MNNDRDYEEVIDFLAAGTSPLAIVEFRPSEETRHRVAELIERAKADELDPDEASELDYYTKIEHLMRMAKARARRHLAFH